MAVLPPYAGPGIPWDWSRASGFGDPLNMLRNATPQGLLGARRWVQGPSSPWIGRLPQPSAVGPSSLYVQGVEVPAATGPTSYWPQRALPPGPGGAVANTIQQGGTRILPTGELGLPSGAITSNAAEQAALGTGQRALGQGAAASQPLVQAALEPGAMASSAARGPGLGLTGNPALSRMATPAAEGLIGAARVGAGAAGAAAEGVPMWVGSAESLAPAAARSGGLLNAARSAMGLGAAEGAGLRAGAAGMLGTVGRGVGVGSIGFLGGNMLDESNLLGGSESAANDYVSKALKLGGVGAGIGTIFPGIGTAVGAGVGGLIGLGWEGLERAGVLKAPTIQEQVDTTIHDADKAAREIGMPSEVTDALKQQYRAQQAFVDPSDKTSRVALAQEYAARVQEQATAFAADPNSFLKSTTTNADPAKRAMLMRSLLVNTIKPYADNYLAQSEATAQSLENMAAGAGDFAPMYQQQAASTRQMGSMYAANLVNQAQVTPYMQALSDQASYLNQMSSNLVSQAMGQVGQAQQPAAGSTDLTAIIDANTNQLQPQ